MFKSLPPIAIGVFFSITALVHAESTSQNDAKLKWALENFPGADTNKDGVLSEAEGRAFLAKAGNSLSKLVRPGGLRPTHADISYGPHDRNKLDLYLAKSEKPTPLLFYIHGGGFYQGDKKQVTGGGGLIVSECQANGISVCSINYRFRKHASMPEILRDCARALQFVRHHADKYNLDKERVVAMGVSAGAGSSLWLAARDDLADPGNEDPILRESSRLVGACCLSGQFSYDITTWPRMIGQAPRGFNMDREIASFQPVKGDREKARQDIHMIGHLSADDPPLFLSSSGRDAPSRNINHYLHHPRHSIIVKDLCDEHGVECTLMLRDAKHPKNKIGNSQVAVREFILKTLKK